MEISDVVRGNDLLGGLSPESLEKFARHKRVRELPRGSTLFREGQEGTAIYVLTRGSLRLFRTDAGGREAVIHMVRPGELFAEAVLFETDSYPVSAEAREDSEVIEVAASRVHELLTDAAFRRDFLATIMRKLRYLARQVYVLSSCDVRERLLRFLAERYGRRTAYRLELSKKEVAAAIATTPETLSRLLAKMERDGTLSWEGQQVTLAPAVWDDVPGGE